MATGKRSYAQQETYPGGEFDFKAKANKSSGTGENMSGGDTARQASNQSGGGDSGYDFSKALKKGDQSESMDGGDILKQASNNPSGGGSPGKHPY